MSSGGCAKLAKGLRQAQTVRRVAVAIAVLAALQGVLAVIFRLVIVLGPGAGNPTVGFFRLGWGPQGIMPYFDAMTAVAALGAPVGLLSILVLLGKAITPTRVPALLAGLWLQAAWLVVAHVVFLLHWGQAIAFFSEPARSAPDMAPMIIVRILAISGYGTGVVLIGIIVTAYVIASRTVVRAARG